MVAEWRTDFLAFYEWSKELYAPGWKFIRYNANLPYSPDNCDYVPMKRKKAVGDEMVIDSFTLPIGISNPSGF
jgi:hypothetical protein